MSQSQSHSAAGKFDKLKTSNDHIGIQTRNLPAHSTAHILLFQYHNYYQQTMHDVKQQNYILEISVSFTKSPQLKDLATCKCPECHREPSCGKCKESIKDGTLHPVLQNSQDIFMTKQTSLQTKFTIPFPMCPFKLMTYFPNLIYYKRTSLL
jgi:hypothetical protein